MYVIKIPFALPDAKWKVEIGVNEDLIPVVGGTIFIGSIVMKVITVVYYPGTNFAPSVVCEEKEVDSPEVFEVIDSNLYDACDSHEALSYRGRSKIPLDPPQPSA